jgi:hypothetical protein
MSQSVLAIVNPEISRGAGIAGMNELAVRGHDVPAVSQLLRSGHGCWSWDSVPLAATA